MNEMNQTPPQLPPQMQFTPTPPTDDPADRAPVNGVAAAIESILRQPKRVHHALRQPGATRVIASMVFVAVICALFDVPAAMDPIEQVTKRSKFVHWPPALVIDTGAKPLDTTGILSITSFAVPDTVVAVTVIVVVWPSVIAAGEAATVTPRSPVAIGTAISAEYTSG